MKKVFLLISFFMVEVFTEASCQLWEGRTGHVEAIVHDVFDSLELIKGPVSLDVISNNECKVYTIRICDQQKFENLSSLLLAALEDGQKNIRVKIKKGTYYFNENHVKLVGQHYPDADIRIEGDGVTVVPKGWILKDGDEIPCDVSGESCFLDLKGKQSVSPWGVMMYADSLVEVVDKAAKRCRLKCKELKGMNVPEGSMAYIDLTRWCRCYQYKVLKVEDGFVEFYAHDLQLDSVFRKPFYNVNYDFVYGKKNPRFRLCYFTGDEPVCVVNKRVRLKNGLKSLYLGNAANFMRVYNSEFNSVLIRGIVFLGSKHDITPLIHLHELKANCIEFEHCRFIGQKGTILSANGTNNLYFHNNYISDNYRDGIVSYLTSANTVIVNNSFENNGLDLSSNRCVTCSGTDYYIANNTFKNFGYCAISIGVWYGTEMKMPSRGIVEYNEIWYDHQYFEEAWKHTIMDAGAIYIWTQNDRAVIRYNYIHDYIGMKDNRGVFCDDGAHHVAVYGNIIVNVPNCHAIGARRIAHTESDNNTISRSMRNNINNFIAYNVIDGSVLFEGHEQQPNGCLKGMNVKMRCSSKKSVETHDYKAEIRNLEVAVKDKEIVFTGYDEKGIYVSAEVMKEMEELSCYEKMRKYIYCVK